MRWNIPVLTLLICLADISARAEDGDVAYVLHANPFAKPLIEAPAAEPPEQEPAPAPRRQLELRATMTAGPDSLVDVNGVIVAVGEEFEGHRLISVRDQAAIFATDDELITLTLDDEATDSSKN